MSRKEPRADSVLGSLPKNQQEQLDFWLFDERPKVEDKVILERLRSDFCVSVSPSMLSRWKKFRKEERLLNTVVASAERANAVIERAEKNPSDTYAALQKLVTHFALHSADSYGGSPENNETLLAFVDRAIKFKREESRGEAVELLRKRLDLMERKVKEAEERQLKLNDAVKKAKEGGLSAEALKEIEERARIL
jgi:hypothetical protein